MLFIFLLFWPLFSITQRVSWYDSKQSDGKAPVLKIWGMRSTPSLPLLSCPLWPGVLAPDWVLPMGQIELCDIETECQQMTCKIELLGIELFKQMTEV